MIFTIDNKSTRYYPHSTLIGAGFDIFGQYRAKSKQHSVFNYRDADVEIVDIFGHEYVLPQFVSFRPQSKIDDIIGTYTSRDEFQDGFSAKLGVKVGIGAFSGQVDVAFSREVSSSADYFFSCHNLYDSLGELTLERVRDEPEENLSKDFIRAIDSLPHELTPSNQFLFDDFFEDFGTHVISRIRLGGALEYYSAVRKTACSQRSQVDAFVEAEYQAATISGKVSAEYANSNEFKRYRESRDASFHAVGGDVSLLAPLLRSALESEQSSAAYAEWLASIKEYPATVWMEFTPISEIAPKKNAVIAKAFDEYARLARLPIVVHTVSHPGKRILPEISIGRLQVSPNIRLSPNAAGCVRAVVINRQAPDDESLAVVLDIVEECSMGVNLTQMWDRLAAKLGPYVLSDEKHLLVLSTAGWVALWKPSERFKVLLRRIGADDGLANWLNLPNDRNRDGCTYTMVGVFDTAAGAQEDFAYVRPGELLRRRTVGYLYRRQNISVSDKHLYEFGAGSSGSY